MRFEEKPGSGNMTEQPPSLEKLYYCAGTTNEAFVMNVARAGTDPTVATPMGILYRQPIQISWTSADQCDVIVMYGPKPKEPGSYSVSFSATGTNVHITNSLETVAKYARPGKPAAPDFKGAIDWDGEEVKGTDKLSPLCKMNVAFSHPQGIFSMDRCRQLAKTLTYVSNDVFFGFAPGEVLFAGFDGSVGSDQETTIQYEFLLQENVEDLTIGDIVGIDKKGWHFLWIQYIDDDNDPNGLPRRIPQHAYVERIYEEIGFVQVFGFGG